MADFLHVDYRQHYSRLFKSLLGLVVVVILLTTGVFHAGSSEKNKNKVLDWTAYTQAGKLALEAKHYDEAELAFKKSLLLASQANKASLEVATSLDYLAQLYQVQGRYLEAEPFFRKAIELYQKRLGRNHAQVKQAIRNLSSLYDSRGQSLDVSSLLLPDPLGTSRKGSGGGTYSDAEKAELANATEMNDLGLLYKSRRKYADAEPLYEKALEIYERIMGTEHPNVAITLSNLAQLARARKKYKRSEILYQRALVIYEKALGPEHLEVATMLTNLGVLYGKQEQYARAEPLLQHALVIREKKLGSYHPSVLKSMVNLAIVYENQDQWDKAKPVYTRALQVAEKIHPPTHPMIQEIKDILADY